MKFTTAASAIVAIAAAAMGAHAQGFKQACNAPYDVCGWTLIDGEHGKFAISPFPHSLRPKGEKRKKNNIH